MRHILIAGSDKIRTPEYFPFLFFGEEYFMQITYSSLGNTIERERARPFVLYRKRRQCKYLKQKRRKTPLLPNLFGKTREGNRMLFPTYEKKTGDESKFSISGHYFCGLLLKFRSPPPSCEGRCMPKKKKPNNCAFPGIILLRGKKLFSLDFLFLQGWLLFMASLPKKTTEQDGGGHRFEE